MRFKIQKSNGILDEVGKAVHACSQLASYVTDEIDSRLQKLNLFELFVFIKKLPILWAHVQPFTDSKV